MAKTPTKSRILRIKAATANAVKAKEKLDGKKFVVDPDGGGAGVIPEADWQKFKRIL